MEKPRGARLLHQYLVLYRRVALYQLMLRPGLNASRYHFESTVLTDYSQ